MHLLEDDLEWHRCLEEMSLVQTGHQLRQLFAIILLHGSPAAPEELWADHQEALTEDILHQAREAARNPLLPLSQQHIDEALRRTERYLISHNNKTLADFPNMPIPPPAEDGDAEPHIIAEQLAYDRQALSAQVHDQQSLLNPEQRAFYNEVRICTTCRLRL